jgi:hypothetical protein
VKAVLFALADRAWEDGSNAYPAIETIAAETEIGQHSVTACLWALRDAGIISEQEPPRQRRARMWRLDLRLLEQLSAPHHSEEQAALAPQHSEELSMGGASAPHHTEEQERSAEVSAPRFQGLAPRFSTLAPRFEALAPQHTADDPELQNQRTRAALSRDATLTDEERKEREDRHQQLKQLANETIDQLGIDTAYPTLMDALKKRAGADDTADGNGFGGALAFALASRRIRPTVKA